MGDLQGFIAALRVGGAMIYPLLLLAVVAVVVVLEKAFIFATRTRLPASLLEVLETCGFAWDDLEQRVSRFGPRNYFGRFFRVILENRQRPAWWVESRAAEEATLIEQSLGRWLWILETIVTAAPLLGLLGTITGMIRAFHLFGSEGLVDPRGVTGGVAEALIATAVGLFIALIALFAFNYFSHRQAQVIDEMEQLGTRVVDYARRRLSSVCGTWSSSATRTATWRTRGPCGSTSHVSFGASGPGSSSSRICAARTTWALHIAITGSWPAWHSIASTRWRARAWPFLSCCRTTSRTACTRST